MNPLLFGMAMIFLLSSPVQAQRTFQAFLAQCFAGEMAKVVPEMTTLLCVEYIAGMVDSHQVVTTTSKAAPLFCLPAKGVSNESLLLSVMDYADKEPRALDDTARTAVIAALRRAFPCK